MHAYQFEKLNSKCTARFSFILTPPAQEIDPFSPSFWFALFQLWILLASSNDMTCIVLSLLKTGYKMHWHFHITQELISHFTLFIFLSWSLLPYSILNTISLSVHLITVPILLEHTQSEPILSHAHYQKQSQIEISCSLLERTG